MLDNNYTGITKLKDWWGKVKANFTYLDNRISTIITTPVDGVSAQEIIDARKGETALGDKIDAMDLEVSTYKADVAKEVKSQGGAVIDGATDDIAAINAFLATLSDGDSIHFSKGDCIISSKVVISKALDIYFENGSRLVPMAGFTDLEAIEITSSNVNIYNIGMDATNLPIETVPYDGSLPAKGLGIRITGTAENRLENINFIGGVIENTPFSAILAEYADHCRVSNLITKNCANNVAATSPAVIVFSESVDPVVKRHVCINPGMKANSFSDCIGGSQTRCYTSGGNVGHAAYYAEGCTGSSIQNNFVKDGFGIKIANGCKGIDISGNKANEAEFGILVQGCTDSKVHNNILLNCVQDGIQIDVLPSAALGNSGIKVHDNIVKNDSTHAAGSDGILINSTGNCVVEDVELKNNKIEKFAYGVRVVRVSTSIYKNFKVNSNTLKTISDTGITICGEDLDINDNTIDGVTTNHGILLSGLVTATETGELRINGNKLTNIAGNGIMAGPTVKALIMEISKNYVNGAAIGIINSGVSVPTIINEGNQIIDCANNDLQNVGVAGKAQFVLSRGNILPGANIYFNTITDMTCFTDGNIALSIVNKPTVATTI